jgi:hypothetical protein
MKNFGTTFWFLGALVGCLSAPCKNSSYLLPSMHCQNTGATVSALIGVVVPALLLHGGFKKPVAIFQHTH